MADPVLSAEELVTMEAFAKAHGIPALLDHLGLDGLGNEVVRLSGERDRLLATVGLLRPEEAANFWHQYRTHPAALSAGAEQEGER